MCGGDSDLRWSRDRLFVSCSGGCDRCGDIFGGSSVGSGQADFATAQGLGCKVRVGWLSVCLGCATVLSWRDFAEEEGGGKRWLPIRRRRHQRQLDDALLTYHASCLFVEARTHGDM